MKGGFISLGSAIEEAYTFDDCILTKTNCAYYIILKFRDEFIHKRISKKKFDEILSDVIKD